MTVLMQYVIPFKCKTFKCMACKGKIISRILTSFCAWLHVVLPPYIIKLLTQEHGVLTAVSRSYTTYILLERIITNSNRGPPAQVFPQESVLGPVLCVLYINEIYRSSNQTRFVHFADDTNVFGSDSDINNVRS